MITVSLQEKPQIAEAEARPQTQTQPQAAPAGWALRIHQIEMKATTKWIGIEIGIEIGMESQTFSAAVVQARLPQ